MGKHHGLSRRPEYAIWNGIRQRCFNPKRPEYARYGAKGITMYPGWVKDFQAFFSYLGERPSPTHSVDRIDGRQGYFPGNVRWATPEQQAQNSTIARPITYQGRTMTVSEWARETGIGFTTLIARLNRNFPLDAVFHHGPLPGLPNSPKILEYQGRKMPVAEWAKEIGITPKALKKRLLAGVPLERALQNPMPRS